MALFSSCSCNSFFTVSFLFIHHVVKAIIFILQIPLFLSLIICICLCQVCVHACECSAHGGQKRAHLSETIVMGSFKLLDVSVGH